MMRLRSRTQMIGLLLVCSSCHGPAGESQSSPGGNRGHNPTDSGIATANASGASGILKRSSDGDSAATGGAANGGVLITGTTHTTLWASLMNSSATQRNESKA